MLNREENQNGSQAAGDSMCIVFQDTGCCDVLVFTDQTIQTVGDAEA